MTLADGHRIRRCWCRRRGSCRCRRRSRPFHRRRRFCPSSSVWRDENNPNPGTICLKSLRTLKTNTQYMAVKIWHVDWRETPEPEEQYQGTGSGRQRQWSTNRPNDATRAMFSNSLFFSSPIQRKPKLKTYRSLGWKYIKTENTDHFEKKTQFICN